MGSGGSLWPFLIVGMVSSVLLALGLLMMKSRGEALPVASGAGGLRAISVWLHDPIWLGGLGVETAGYALYVIALAAPVSLIAVVMQAGIALFVLFAVVFLNERARPHEWIGICAIVLAMILLAWSIGGGAAQGGVDSVALLVLTAVGIAIAAAPSMDTRMRVSGAAPAIASGIAFGLGSLYTKALADILGASTAVIAIERILVSPWLYLTIAANLAGLVMLQNAFHRARGIIAMPLSSACSNVVPIVGGMVAFGELLPADAFAATMRAAAFVLTIAASALLAMSRSESGMTAGLGGKQRAADA